MSNSKIMLHNALTNRAMDIYKDGSYDINEVSAILESEINETLSNSYYKISIENISKKNILSIINSVITNIKANSNGEEWGEVCIDSLKYIKSNGIYINKEEREVCDNGSK